MRICNQTLRSCQLKQRGKACWTPLSSMRAGSISIGFTWLLCRLLLQGSTASSFHQLCWHPFRQVPLPPPPPPPAPQYQPYFLHYQETQCFSAMPTGCTNILGSQLRFCTVSAYDLQVLCIVLAQPCSERGLHCVTEPKNICRQQTYWLQASDDLFGMAGRGADPAGLLAVYLRHDRLADAADLVVNHLAAYQKVTYTVVTLLWLNQA